MRIAANTVRRLCLDYTANTQECSLTLYYGFGSESTRLRAPDAILPYMLEFWAPKLQQMLGDMGEVGGARMYSDEEPEWGTDAQHWHNPATDELIESTAPCLAVQFNCYQADVVQRIQKRVYLPISKESSIVDGKYAPAGGDKTNADNFAFALAAQLTIPNDPTPVVAIPVIKTNSLLGAASPDQAAYYTLWNAKYNEWPAQKRSRQLRNQFSWNGPDISAPTVNRDFNYASSGNGPSWDTPPDEEQLPPLPPAGPASVGPVVNPTKPPCHCP